MKGRGKQKVRVLEYNIFTFAPNSRPIWLLYQSRPICLKKVFAPTA